MLHHTADTCNGIRQDVLSKEPENIDVTFCLIILRSNKTTVSVVTIQNEYCLLYLSNGLVCNSACRAQKNVVSLVAFLSVPKGTFCHSRYHWCYLLMLTWCNKQLADCEFTSNPHFRKFRCQLFHACYGRGREESRAPVDGPLAPSMLLVHFSICNLC